MKSLTLSGIKLSRLGKHRYETLACKSLQTWSSYKLGKGWGCAPLPMLGPSNQRIEVDLLRPLTQDL